MASMAFSTLTMFFPQNSVIIAALILCALFFGVYIPWQERKKKGGKAPRPKTSRAPRREKMEQSASRPGGTVRLDQLDSLRDAGLLTREEYEQRKRELSGK